MRQDRAQHTVDTIIDTHVEQLGGTGDPSRVAQALRNAKSDLHLLIEQIFDECGFEAAADQAIELTREDPYGDRAESLRKRQAELEAEYPDDQHH